MRLSVGFATAVALASAWPMAGHAADPDAVNLFQARQPAPVQPPNVPSNASSNGDASGISNNPSNDTPGVGQQNPGLSTPNSAPPRVGLFPAVGKTLLDAGVDIHGFIFDHFIANPSAGIKTGEVNNLAVFSPAIDFDLQKIIGIPGGQLHTQMYFFGLKGDIPSITTKTGGFLTGFQTTPAVETQELAVLTYEQRFWSDRLSFEVGRTNPFRFFLLANSIDFFTSVSSVVQTTGDFNAPPYPVWGGRATYHFTPEWYLQGGVFEDNYRRALSNSNNFGVTANSGFTSIGELGYRSEFNNAAFPVTLETGVLFNERHGDVTTLKGTGIPYSAHLQPADYRNGGALFAQGAKVVWRGERTDYGPPTNLSLYGSMNTSFDKPQPFDFDTVVGATYTGFIPRRPFDAVGVQAHYSRLSQIEADFETKLEQAAGGPGSTPKQSRNGFAFEVTGNVQVTEVISLRLIIEYFVNPDAYYNRGSHGRPSDGFMAGVFGYVAIGRLLGTSEKAF